MDGVISTALQIYHSQYLEQKPILHDRSVMYTMTVKLLKYLRPEYSAYHLRSVSLIWSLESSSSRSHVESILAQMMNSHEAKKNDETYEAFGVLWRLTGEQCFVEYRAVLMEQRGCASARLAFQNPNDDRSGHAEG